MFRTNCTELTSQVRVKMILTKVFTTICQRSILYYIKYNHEDIAELKDSHLRVRHFVADKEKLHCIYRMSLMSSANCSRVSQIGMPNTLESIYGTSTLIFHLPSWEPILIEDTTLLKVRVYTPFGYMDRFTIA
jgi:hypothetical protein